MGVTVYGVRGWGSAIAEGLLALAEVPYDFVDVAGFDAPGPVRDRLLALNPLGQVPTLVLADGTVLTESAAVALHLADHAAGLAPPAGDPDRPRFLRLLVWVVANVYPTFTYGDYPARWTPTDPTALRESTDRHREALYRWFEQQIALPHVLGERLSALDVYVAVLLNWRPGRAWFAAHAPRMVAAGDAAAADPRLGPVLTLNRAAF